MKPLVKVSRYDKLSRDQYISLYAKLQELRKLSTKENKDLIQPIVDKIKTKLFHSKYVITYQDKEIGTTSRSFVSISRKLEYLKDYIHDLRVERKRKKELKEEEVKVQGYTYTKVGGLRVTPITQLKRKHHPKFAREYKKPVITSNYIGIEIEMVSDINLEQMAVLLALNKLDHKIRVMSDGSISSNGDSEVPYTFEINILDTEYNINNTLDKFSKMLVDSDFKFKTNLSCGTHIHFDMRNRDVEEAYSNLYDNLDSILKTVHPSRLDNRYCKRNKASTHSEAQDIYAGSGARYQMLNPESYSKHQTLEVRVFEGTLDMDKIKSWISMCLGIINNGNLKAVANV